ncbi:MAG: hypothetical protein KC996_09780 [Phycisphaerales bacterium]|nr:hypothetical protein [Phycisphaerales bacterium]
MQRAVIGGGLLVLASVGANAGIYSFDGTGEIFQFGFGFGGADSYPFAGLNHGDAMAFHFVYDTSVSAVSDDGMAAEYLFAGGESFVEMGGTSVGFDSFRVLVGEFSSGGGFLSFIGRNESLGLTAVVALYGASGQPTALPTAFDHGEFTWSSEFSVNSDENQFLLPVVFGDFLTGEITPAPGTGLMMLGGLVLAGRRRR